MVDRNSPIPLYYQLKLHFKQQMESGELHAGDRLPTEMEICEQFEISRAPVRQALTELAREGLIYRRAGQGTFVAPHATANLEQKTILHVLAHYDVRWMASLEDAIHLWNLQHPEHEVQLEVALCSREDYHYALRRAVAQGNAPDIVPLDYVWITDYAHAGYITALNELDALWVDEFLQDMEVPIIKNNMWSGRLYGVPVQADITGLWYRKDWFVSEGVEPPHTWDAWLNLVDYFATPEVKQRLGHKHSVVLPVTSMAGEATVNLLIPFIWMNGGDIIDAAGQIALDSSQVCESLYFLQELSLKRRAAMPGDIANSRWWDLVRFFARGMVPMALGGTYEWPRIREESDLVETEDEVAEHMGFMLMPRPTIDVAPVGSLGGTSWAILRQSSIQDLSMELLKLASLPETSRSFCEENLQISPHHQVNARFNVAEHPWLSMIMPLLPLARTRPLVHNYIQISRFLQQMFEKVLWTGESVEETVQYTVQSLSLLLER
ncbi:MAG: extracellular solute-binding protein [Anaerolineae bacterium]|nr:extracellular solute-binding protein [Anaerolineae bacterium]